MILGNKQKQLPISPPGLGHRPYPGNKLSPRQSLGAVRDRGQHPGRAEAWLNSPHFSSLKCMLRKRQEKGVKVKVEVPGHPPPSQETFHTTRKEAKQLPLPPTLSLRAQTALNFGEVPNSPRPSDFSLIILLVFLFLPRIIQGQGALSAARQSKHFSS